jgi:Ca2+-binding RTX toxin-like protein
MLPASLTSFQGHPALVSAWGKQSSGGNLMCIICQQQALSRSAAASGSGKSLSTLLPIYQADDGSYYFSGNQDIDAVLIGSKWAETSLTFSFPTNGTFYGADYSDGRNDELSPFNAMQAHAAETALNLVASYTQLTFAKIEESATDHATLRFAQTTHPDVDTAQGGFPAMPGEEGDVWFGETGQPYYTTPVMGNWGWATIMHEIGHALGLKHGMDDYTTEDLSELFEVATPRPGTQALPPEHDGQAWSLMTYRGYPGSPNYYHGDLLNEPQTFMQNDIAALQYLYGANFNSHAGNNVYSWSPETGEMFIDGISQGQPTANKIFRTIWDGNGVDTYDLSNYSSGVAIDLRPGAFSTFSTAQLADVAEEQEVLYYAPGNIANALLYQDDTRSLIENAIGTAGRDLLIGNQANNILSGGAGYDILAGEAGGDLLLGGTGVDVAWFGLSAQDSIITGQSNGIVSVQNAAGLSMLSGIELMRFEDQVVLVETPADLTSFADGRAFDSSFYLAQNADVAEAVEKGWIASGLDHYLHWGAQEGRDANVLFDEMWYLGVHADVAAAVGAGIFTNAYEHYVHYGWSEGRDPSAWMDMSAYLATYQDVAAAHIDPLRHFLTFGVNEGRTITAGDLAFWA